MKMNIKKFAEITGVSVRTLHYYDEIGLLKPEYTEKNNKYRFYGEKQFEIMQEILFYRELDFSLKTIKEILSSPEYNKKEALSMQKNLLLLKKQQIEKIIEAIENAEKGDNKMDLSVFNNSKIEKQRKAYKNEATKRWGSTKEFKESEQKTENYTNENWNELENGINSIMKKFADALNSGTTPQNEYALSLAEELKNFISKTQYNCTNEILLHLGNMYVEDERFKQNIDKNGKGTANFINETIKEYCKKSEK